MKIVWRLDVEKPIEPENLLGNITISDAQTYLEEHDTYIDSWLDAFITGLNVVQTGRRVAIDIPEEPLPLGFEPVGKRIRISYGNRSIEVQDAEELRSVLRITAQELLRKLEDVKGWESNQLLNKIRDFACATQVIAQRN